MLKVTSKTFSNRFELLEFGNSKDTIGYVYEALLIEISITLIWMWQRGYSSLPGGMEAAVVGKLELTLGLFRLQTKANISLV